MALPFLGHPPDLFLNDGIHGLSTILTHCPNIGGHYRVSITERPKEVEQKTRLGDWECDTVIGEERKSVLVTVVDRASLYTACSRVLSRSAQVVSQAIIRLLRPFKERVQTLTFDNVP
ncbi:IS30 family transposase [Candidatus Nitrospira salsa]